MAKKKKTTKRKTTRRKSRMSGAGSDMTPLLLIVGGAIAGKLLNKVIPETVDKRIVNGGKVALPLLIPMLVKDQKTKSMFMNIAMGLAAQGSIELLTDMNVLTGAEEEDEFIEVDLSGVQDVLAGIEEDLNVINGQERVLAGDDDLAIINGYMSEE